MTPRAELLNALCDLIRVVTRTLLLDDEIMSPHCPNRGMTGNLGYLIEGHAGIVGDVDIARPKLPKLDVQAGSLPDRFSGLRQPSRCSLTGAPGEDQL